MAMIIAIIVAILATPRRGGRARPHTSRWASPPGGCRAPPYMS